MLLRTYSLIVQNPDQIIVWAYLTLQKSSGNILLSDNQFLSGKLDKSQYVLLLLILIHFMRIDPHLNHYINV